MNYSSLWNPHLRNLSPYIPGEQPAFRCIKLNTNENPFAPSPAVLCAIQKAIDCADSGAIFRRYPDPESKVLAQALAEFHGVLPDNIFVGNGSDEVLAHTFFALLKHQKPVAFPEITYSFYPVYARLFDIPTQTIPLKNDFSFSADDFLVGGFGAVIFPNPNAPTGRLFALKEIEKLCEKLPEIPIVIDEAYIDFSQKNATAVPLLAEFKNLLIVRTFSKSRAMAGLRFGYAVGDFKLIEALKIVKNSFNSYPINALTEVAALASLKDNAYFEAQCQKIIENREFLAESLKILGFEVVPSDANFIFAKHPKFSGDFLFKYLKENGVLVRHFNVPKIENFLRITIGTKDNCKALIHVLKGLI